MKHWHVFKQQYKLLISVFVCILAFTFFNLVTAQTAEELENKIDQKNSEIKKLEQDIKAYQNEILQLSKEKDSLSNTIKQLDLNRKKLNTDIAITQKQIDKTNIKISSLSSDISMKELSIDNTLNAVANSIKILNNYDQTTTIEIILAEDITEMWNDLDQVISVRDKLREEVNNLRSVKTELEGDRDESISARDELVSLKNKLADQKKVVDQNAKEKSNLLSQTKNSEANYQKLLAGQIAKKVAFGRELRDYESQLKYILDPNRLPNAGVLSWPLDDIFVTQEFGAKTGPHRTYASGHSGTDFRARTPLPTYAMSDGIVKGVGDTDLACPGASFGKWVFVEFNNGLSATYGHLSFIRVKEGQKVNRGEVLGYTGGTGRVTGPHLHVSLYVADAVKVETLPSKSCPGRILKQPIAPINAYLDPMYYLPPYNR